MKIRNFLQWLHNRIHNYNLFIPDENDYEHENDEPIDPETVVKHERYATRLYVPLLIIIVYILIFITVINPQTRLVTIRDITPSVFSQLQIEHGDTLSCPCTNITVPYNTFVSTSTLFHPVCRSTFVRAEWIKALYLPNASIFHVMDFRTTASSQFELLAAFCTLCEETVNQAIADFNNNQLVTMELLQEYEVESHIDGNVEIIRTTRSNALISALNTNAIVTVFTPALYSDDVYVASTYYFDKNAFHFTASSGSPCYLKSSLAPSGFYSLPEYYDEYFRRFWPYFPPIFEPNPFAMVDGFYGGCTPLDGLLASTLDCLYNVDCLQILPDYFSTLNEINLNLSSSVLSSGQANVPLKISLSDLLIEKWSTKMNYSKYFIECAPTFCTYTKTDHMNLSDAITLFISLYGGLTIILRIVVVFLVKVSLKSQRRLLITNVNNEHHRVINIRKLFQWIKQLNMFKSINDRTADAIQQQRITTRTYLILLGSSIVILCLFTSLNTQTITMTVSNLSLVEYKELHNLRSDTLKCPCQNVTIPYGTVLSLSATFHEVCSSDYVSESWISLNSYVWNSDVGEDPDDKWLGLRDIHFRLLSTLCQLANKTINDAISRFNRQSFITLNVLTELEFDTQLNATYKRFIQSLIIDFSLLVNTVRLFDQIDQPYTLFDNAYLMVNNPINQIRNESHFQLKFHFGGMRNMSSTSFDCICATDPHCHSPVIIGKWSSDTGQNLNMTFPYVVPGMIKGCFTIDTLLLSTLECYYSTSCISIQYVLINETFARFDTDLIWFRILPLIYDRESSRFPPHTSLSFIVKEMLIEQWNLSFSFNHYYNACAPIHCTYSLTTYTTNTIGVIIKLLSTIAGLTVVLRFITPLLINIIFSLLRPKPRRQNQDNMNLFGRMKKAVGNLMKFLYTTLINLNLYPIGTFGVHVDRIKAQVLGRWSTRLYIVLLIISFVTLGLYTVILPSTLTKILHKPSLTLYNDLLIDHSDTLECPCSSVSSKYNEFLQITPVFHSVCSSPFVTDEWRINMTEDLIRDLSVYDVKDYRLFFSSHLQLLSGLCNLSSQSVDDSIEQFLSSLFVGGRLLPQTSFHTQIHLLIEQSKSSALTKFDRLLSLLRLTVHGNAIVTAYGTNYEYSYMYYNSESSFGMTKPLTYDKNCSCAVTSNCTSEATFIQKNSSEIFSIKGLKMGCTPSESFLLSTLECFYNSSCIYLIRQFTTNISNKNYTKDVPLLFSANMSRFLVNTTIIELVRNLFIEHWSTTINYTSYFKQCSPIFCSYTYVQQLNSLYTITLLLGLYGGLTFVLNWICPELVHLLDKIYQFWKKRKNVVEPVSSLQMNTIETVDATTTSTNVHNTTTDLNLVPTVPTTMTKLCSTLMRCFIVSVILLILMITAIIITSVYLSRERKNDAALSTLPTKTTILNTTPTTTIPTSTALSCRLTLDSLVSFITEPDSSADFPIIAVGKLNSDDHLDIAVVRCSSSTVDILFGVGDGTFQEQISYSTGGECPISIVIGDFNSDGHADLAVANYQSGNIGVLLGNDDEDFETVIVSSSGEYSGPYLIVGGDYNDDGYLDIAVLDNNMKIVRLLVGNNNGTFEEPRSFCEGICIDISFIVVGDFNNDGRQDFAALRRTANNVYVLLSNDTASLSKLVILPTGRFSEPSSIAVADFNNDNEFDLAIANTGKDNIGIMIGNGNGTFQPQMIFSTGGYSFPTSIIVTDFNNDGQLDLAVTNSYAHNVGILIGFGNGTFQTQITFSTGPSSMPFVIASGDFNSDGHVDLLIIDDTLKNLGILFNTCHCCGL